MKVNGKLWTLALGFKEGLSLGDRTSAQSTLLTWGVNSVWSNLNSWREEWRQHQTLYKSLEANSSIYGFWNDIKTHKCGAININCSAQAGLHWTMHEAGATMKLWRFLRMPSLGCTNVSTRAGRSFRSHEAWTFVPGATQLLVRSLDWWCGLHVSRALGRIGTKMQTSVRAQIDYCFVRCRIEGTCFSFGIFYCSDMFRPQKRHSISEPSGVSFQPFCLLQVSGVIMLLLGTSWFKPRKIEIKPRSPCAGDKLASLLAHLTGTNSQGCQFPCWNCSGPLSFGLVQWFCPSKTNLPLLHGCASGSNSSGWKRGSALALAYTCWKSDNS